MFKSLYSKLALALLGLFCLLGLSIVTLTQFASDMYQQEVIQKLNKNLAKQIVTQKILMKDHKINEEGLKEIFDMLMVVNPSIEVYLLNPVGEILAYAAPRGKVKLHNVDLEPLKKWYQGDAVLPLTGDDPRNPDRRKVFTAARIPEQGQLQGHLYIILGGEIFDSIVQKLKGSYIMQISFWWIVASLFFVLITGLLLFAYLTRRLTRLASVVDSFDLNQTAVQLQSILGKGQQRVDEIGRLTHTFQQLVKRIQAQMNKLKEADTLLRELVANVSHDLRTPLATLQGYIETLFLKGESLTAEDRKHHLEIAIAHCERLNKLVTELFELAKLDSHETKIRCELFNICELAQDVVQKFYLSVREKQVEIQIDRNQSLPFVYADIAMIERVIENLLENAVRHTPSGGKIRLTFSPHNGDIAVCVSDTGYGIPEEDLPFIFDRFYRKDINQKGSAGYSGLGLAIAKRILDLHHRTINVESTLGTGTNFTFFLPARHPA
ncbi:MAG: HAMP domain-containing histidine kinase [Deltaproteobacteria bacterium]|nr:MAG: HAMP domain-containing histidine kinase [Deltaproteobacteria bacterium]